jgi:Na+/melibiose symporter-like transporter
MAPQPAISGPVKSFTSEWVEGTTFRQVQQQGRRFMSLGLILIIILIIFLLGGFSGRFGGYGYGYGHGGVGVIGVIIIILVVLVLMGRL